MPSSKQVGLSEMFGGESDRVKVSWELTPPKDPAEQARAHVREIVVTVVRTVVTLAAFVLVYGLSGLFLRHGNAEQAEKVVIAGLGILSGFGLGEIGRKAAARD